MPTGSNPLASLPEPLLRIVEARHHDPFEVLGRHELEDGNTAVRAILPQAERARINDAGIDLERIPNTDLFHWEGPTEALGDQVHQKITWYDRQGRVETRYDPYTFGPQLGDFDLHLFGEGRHWHAYRFLGAHQRTVDGIEGFQFGVWAPGAHRVSVIGEFNQWDGRCHPMRVRGGSGVWELFIPGIEAGALYKFEVRDGAGHVHVKIDP
jgi:1,4-alpha-glucan branching enzyme